MNELFFRQTPHHFKVFFENFPEKDIYYNHDINYRMNITIRPSTEAKKQLREFLLSSEDTISIDDAIRRAKKRWQK